VSENKHFKGYDVTAMT